MDSLPENSILEFVPGTLEQVRNYFDLNKSKIEKSLQILEEWIQKQQHFVSKNFDRAYLERVLISRKGSLEKAKLQIDKMCTLRTLLPKYFKALATKEDIKSVMDQCVIVPLPKMTKDHNRIIWLKIDHTNITPDTLVLYCRFSMHINEYIATHDYHNRIVIIEDYRGANLLELMMKVNILDLQQIMSILIDGYGMRVWRIHVITDSKIADMIMKFAIQFVSKKIASRIMIHENIEDLQKYIDQSILPIELGGTEKSLDSLKKEWVDVLSEEKHIEYVKKKSKFCTNENFRLDEKFNNLYLGTPGSFKNVIID